MDTTETLSPTLESIVEKLKGKSEEELKLLYIRLFADDIAKEIEEITSNSRLSKIKDAELDEAFMKNRYGTL